MVPGARAVPSETTRTSRSPIVKLFVILVSLSAEGGVWRILHGDCYLLTSRTYVLKLQREEVPNARPSDRLCTHSPLCRGGGATAPKRCRHAAYSDRRRNGVRLLARGGCLRRAEWYAHVRSYRPLSASGRIASGRPVLPKTVR